MQKNLATITQASLRDQLAAIEAAAAAEGLTARRFVEKHGVSRRTLQRWRAGLYRPRPGTLRRLLGETRQ